MPVVIKTVQINERVIVEFHFTLDDNSDVQLWNVTSSAKHNASDTEPYMVDHWYFHSFGSPPYIPPQYVVDQAVKELTGQIKYVGPVAARTPPSMVMPAIGPLTFDQQLDMNTTLSFTFACNKDNEVEVYTISTSTKSPGKPTMVTEWRRNRWSHEEHKWMTSHDLPYIPPKDMIVKAVSEFQKRIRYIGQQSQ